MSFYIRPARKQKYFFFFCLTENEIGEFVKYLDEINKKQTETKLDHNRSLQ